MQQTIRISAVVGAAIHSIVVKWPAIQAKLVGWLELNGTFNTI